MARTAALVLALLVATCQASNNDLASESGANPIRKVVGLLQKMEKTVVAEGEKEKELYDKYMCYCKNGAASLSASIDTSNTKIPQLESSIDEAVANKAQLSADIKQHQTDRDAAKAAMAEATALREKEAAAYAAQKSQLETDIAMVKKATMAVENGMSGSFLQTAAAAAVRNLVTSSSVDLTSFDRETLTSFLSTDAGEGEDYAPSSGQITGIMKQMSDTMTDTLNRATDSENSSIKLFDELMAAKTKEVQSATDAIEKKTVRVGELGVQIAGMTADLEDTREALGDDSQFLKDMEKNCKAKSAEWEARSALRSEELVALADTIKLLNDDDALELFKKTLPGSSLLQVTGKASHMSAKARDILEAAKKTAPGGRTVLDLITFALSGRKVNFDKVIQMVDKLVVTLKAEQQDDDHKKEYCVGQFDAMDDKKKGLVRTLDDLSTTIDETTSSIATLAAEVEALEDGIKALDKQVAEATEQRKEEHEDYQNLMAENAAAKELLGFAKNRLNKFYNPKLYKAPASFVQISSHVQKKDAPPPPPEADLSSGKKGEEATGVIGMIDTLAGDLTKEMTEAEAEEKNSQGDYISMMSDSAAKRAADSKAIADKSGMKAGLEEELEAAKSSQTDKTKELMATEEYISSLHAECDWLMQNFDIRKTARSDEIDSLTKAKAVLSGADFSLLQTNLRR